MHEQLFDRRRFVVIGEPAVDPAIAVPHARGKPIYDCVDIWIVCWIKPGIDDHLVPVAVVVANIGFQHGPSYLHFIEAFVKFVQIPQGNGVS
ncbi:MAG: hypothetical protein ACYDA8_01295 [Deferrisomatales bacterium]